MENKNYATFLKLDLSGHIGEWIAICKGGVIAKGKNIKEVYNDTKKKCPQENPLIVKVPEKETMIF